MKKDVIKGNVHLHPASINTDAYAMERRKCLVGSEWTKSSRQCHYFRDFNCNDIMYANVCKRLILFVCDSIGRPLTVGAAAPYHYRTVY